MKRLFFALLISLCASLLFSQEMSEIKNNDLINKNALIFTFNGFHLNSANGGIGWKKWTRENRAINATLEVIASMEQKDAGQELTGAEVTQIDIQLTGGVEKRFPIRHRLSPYLGALFGLGYDKLINKIKPSERLSWSMFDSEYRSETKTTLYYCSAHFVVGVEYFFRNNLSLSGQYQLGGDYRFGEEKNISTVVEEVRDISKINLGVWRSSLILSVYF
jgi:hypothetical protein